ncbi:hypothetical protein F5884DRAFT_332140 [Xylogone sp. PMI_703]|nr:hypothetical protein F5884DRAFT_332140 [Xylogone sp. PMI_703]
MTKNVGLQLFPPQPSERQSNNPYRKASLRRDPVTPPQPIPQSDVNRTGSPAPPSEVPDTNIEGHQSALSGRQSAFDERASPIPFPPPAQLGSEIPRSQTSLSDAPTLVRSNSNSSDIRDARKQIQGSPQREEPIMRSIFPRYNPDLPLEHQKYYPTQASPTHMPKTVISRSPYSPSLGGRSPAGLQSPLAVGQSPGRFPSGLHDESILEPSSTEDLKEFWKVACGWKVSASEGRKFCLKMTSASDTPIHTLSSATQPLYTLRLDPTSTSAQMMMSRHDPNKTVRESSSSKANQGLEIMSTTLEETARRFPPNDGLVALLYPQAAANVVLDLANKPGRADQAQVIAAAERECGRLVWDEDSKRYYLVHPATSNPFVVTINSSPAWSRVEYVLEHPELPHNLVRLVRDGAGSGYLDVDTGVAAKIDCFYIVDVAICAIMLVALSEEKSQNLERFDAPPSITPVSPALIKGKRNTKIEEMDIDIESQESLKDKKDKSKEKDKVPGCLGLIWMLMKCMFWLATMLFKAVAYTIIGISKCLTRSKK